jgi:hypothetical protein
MDKQTKKCKNWYQKIYNFFSSASLFILLTVLTVVEVTKPATYNFLKLKIEDKYFYDGQSFIFMIVPHPFQKF